MTDSDKVEWVVLETFGARYLAEIQIQTLEAEGIPVLIKGEEAGIWGGGFPGPTSQGIQLLVPTNAVADARELLELDEEE